MIIPLDFDNLTNENKKAVNKSLKNHTSEFSIPDRNTLQIEWQLEFIVDGEVITIDFNCLRWFWDFDPKEFNCAFDEDDGTFVALSENDKQQIMENLLIPAIRKMCNL